MNSLSKPEIPQQKLIKNSSFISNTLLMMGGTIIGALITIVASPVLLRYFNPDTFGIFSVFSSIVGLISIISCMKYELAIMLPESDEEAINLFALSLLIIIFISVILIPFIWFFQSQIIVIFKLPSLGFYILIIPFLVFFNGVFMVLFWWNTRTRHFKMLAGARITNSIVTSGSQLGSAFMGFATVGGLIIGSFLGTFASIIVLSLQIWKNHKPSLKSFVSWRSMLHCLKRYLNFPIYSSPASILNALSWQLPIFMLAFFFSPHIVGLYSLGLMVVLSPMSIIGNSLALNFFQKAVDSKNKGTLGRLVEEVFEILVIVGLYPIFLLTLVGANIFIVIFGPTWGEAGIYTQILSVWAFVWFVSAPLSDLFSVLEKQAYEMKLNIVILGSRFGSLAIGGLLGDPRIALALFSGTGILIYGFMNWSIMHLSGGSPQHVRKVLINNFILFVPAGLLILFFKFLDVSNYLMTVSSVIVLLAYYAYLLKTNEKIKGIFNQILGGLIHT